MTASEEVLRSSAATRLHIGAGGDNQYVALVVAVDEDDAAATVDALGDLDDRRRRRGGEDVAQSRAVRVAGAHVAEERRLVPGAAAGDDGDATGLVPRRGDDPAP